MYTIHPQAEELKLQREEMSKNAATQVRGLHFSLQELAISDMSGELQKVWFASNESKQTFRQSAYVNLVLSHWEMQFEHGLISKGELLQLAKNYMHSYHFGTFWKRTREYRAAMARAAGRREAEIFHEILDSAYKKAFNSDAGEAGAG